MSDWTPAAARRLYNLPRWSGGYFDVGEAGDLAIRPCGPEGPTLDWRELAAGIREQGLHWPVLIRFADILRDRVRRLTGAFATACEQEGYGAAHTAVYPIKVNQQRSVVETIRDADPEAVGLEAGSKPELMAVLGLSRPGGTVICNGYKDREYIRLALAGRRMGLAVYIVVEKLSELDLVLEEAERMGQEPLLGVRVRLASIGAGKWQNTGGDKSKFGLSASQVLAVAERLRAAGRADCLRLMHFHLGSQIPNIRDIQRGLREGARYYAELRRMGLPVETVDVGGGLGVDYEGTRSRSACSINYTLQEYANNVVRAFAEMASEAGLPCPHLITESGRAMTAHHAVLVTNVIDTERVTDEGEVAEPDAEAPRIVRDLWEGLNQLRAGDDARSPLEAHHDASHWLAEAQQMYVHGVLDLDRRAEAERLFYATAAAVRQRLQPTARSQREVLDDLNERLADKYFLNFSLFQSLPDVWAIDQIFPVMPLQRLDERPDRRGIIEDITCDSDGRIDAYVDGDGLEASLPLHAPGEGEEYLLGFFMVGAYQEILGDMHNLFGDTDSVTVELDGEGGYRLGSAERGDTVDSVLRYVRFDPAGLLAACRETLAASGLDAEAQATCLDELAAGLRGYTYLED
ncbi:arginine decarboxylase [Thiohalospira halophila DSM 15071]|uniref:Biosynthetic arginine decarboxylase n=1 Tax=Thiohalospira halophila DSM 15071 TaxID=1123397 RepID=A0A1I1VYK5_9GAMM|nr:biosynthetic arginine decarboxylase [Thiohalospira halophila]SFD88047.1 arginine decarboxylase [Thiohalospira halophila DSM 15071]